MTLLKRYRQKRSFKKTPEPKGKVQSTPSKNLYVIQKHAASHLHYDFRLELNGVLKSWAVPKGPSLDPAIKRLAVHVEDHPISYGHFEGIIPKGQYGGGTVMLWDEGVWISEDSSPQEAYKKGHLTFSLKGKKLKGKWTLIQIRSQPKQWLLIKVQDHYAKKDSDYNILEKKSKSVLTHKTLEGIAGPENKKKSKKITIDLPKKKFLKNVKPALATLVDKPPAGKNWLHEIKWDGYRLLAFIQDKAVRLMTRGNQDWTHYFRSIADQLKALQLPNAILDGEIVVLDNESRSQFQLLQNAIHDHDAASFIYYVFDLLYYDQYDMTTWPLIKRKELLQRILPSKGNQIRYSDHVIGEGEAVFQKSCELGLEGIVSKKIDSPYLQKRTQNWLKSKCTKRQEFVVGGYTLPQGTRRYFGSLLLGIYKKEKLVYCGHVGTGFNEQSLKRVFDLLSTLKTTHIPFNARPPNSKQAIWVLPKVIIEVEFTEWTSDGMLRHPSFKGIRKDKPAKEIVHEKPLHPLSHPDKIVYPEDNITKADLYGYYQSIKDWILPYIINRPLTLVRCPNNYHQSCFYQKHLDKKSGFSKDIKLIPIKEKNKKANYIYMADEEGLLAFPQLNVLEIHPWGSSVDDIEYPDRIVFDLDPSPEVKWGEVVKAALLIREKLKKLKLVSFVKTTGGKGLHVVVPIQPKHTWEEVKHFSHQFVNDIVSVNPNRYIANMNKAKRRGKIYIDYLRNQRGATAVAPYSTRARLHAPVAMPMGWEELSHFKKPPQWTVKNALVRLKKLKKDPWGNFFKVKQSIP